MGMQLANVLFSQEEIQTRVRALAAEIDALYKDEELVMVCVLKGAFLFFSDLVRYMTIAPKIEFVRLASYGDNTSSTKNIAFTKDVEISLEGKHVLIVEDIVDSGHSMDFLFRQLAARGARSLRLATLIDKHERREVPIHAHFVGFALKKGFTVGYGMDYAEQYRTLPTIYDME